MSEQMISAAEWQAMRVIWAQPGARSQRVIQSLQEGFDWQPATIKTLLGRLRKKGYLEMRKEDAHYHYYPLISEEKHLEAEIARLLDNVCSTKHATLVAQLVAMGQFSQSHLQVLSDRLAEQVETAPPTLICHCIPGQCTCGCHHRKEPSCVIN